MRLQRLDLVRYGRFTDRAIDFGPKPAEGPDLHIVYGPNEAGKSTSLNGYLDVLFGIQEQSRYAFLHPYASMEVGAVLDVDGAVHEVRRIKQRSNSLRDLRGEPLPPALLAAPLGGLTRDGYRMMFSLDDETLELGGEAILDSQGDIGELLFSASSGLADLSRKLDAVSAEADGIFRKRASTTRIAALKRRLTELKASRDEIDVQASEHARLAEALARADEAYAAAARDLGIARARADELARILRALPLRAERDRLLVELEPLAGLPRPPAHWSADMPALRAREAELSARARGLDAQIAALAEELDRPQPEAALHPLGDRLARLAEATARYRTAAEDLPKRRRALAEADRELAATAAALGRPGEADPAALALPAALMGQLRDLIEQQSGVAAGLASAAREVDDAREALLRAEDEHRRLVQAGTALAPEAVAALETALAPLRQGDLAAREAMLEREADKDRRALEAALTTLRPWTGEPAVLAALAMPEPAEIAAWRRSAAELEAEAARCRRQAQSLTAERDQAAAARDALRSAAGLVDDAAAMALRAERETAWAAHLGDLGRQTAAAFEAAMRAADAVADARAAHADRLAEMRTHAVTVSTRQAALDRETEALAAADGALAALRRTVRARHPVPEALPEDAPLAAWLDAAERWAARRGAALEAHDRLQEAETRLAAARAEQDTARRGLSQALSAIGLTPGAFPLPALVQAAEAALKANAERARQAEAAADAMRDRQRDLDTRTRRAEAARAAMQTWADAWEAALAATWFADRGGSTGAVRAILDLAGGLPAALKARDDIAHRIAAMEEDCRSFVTELGLIHQALGEPFEEPAALAAAEMLMRRHEQARIEETMRREMHGKLAGLREERQALQAEVWAHEAERDARLTFFGVDDLVAVGTCLQTCARRDALAGRAKDLADRIAGEMRASGIEEALERLDRLDAEALATEAAEIEATLDRTEAQARDLYAAKSLAAERLQAIGGDDAVARIEAERRVVILEIEDLALRFLRLRAGRMLVDQALTAYRDRHRSSMMQRASEAFRLITREAYLGLTTRADKDREVLIALSRDGGSKAAQDLSKGTRFQLYLALRLAGYEEFAAVRPPVPFIADDIMETFDEMRSEEAFRLFGRMGAIGQVIYFTHHRHLCDIAARVVPGVRIHDLAP
ncbi:AAA family ATPase [Phreatobacter cathodiphilus]|uniref:YhaN AAA domain-containing protein n=1 Tax=Phreatobacter cathodiphilus TaxID=1868589 RepID=A0A2S0ND47_9HYPH|nr:AAA family ATPase [Phreatobacter cathodiphilus]AVO45833.1 hypothetical protein C6569_12570 [Phreatobacter cathodiphilus]